MKASSLSGECARLRAAVFVVDAGVDISVLRPTASVRLRSDAGLETILPLDFSRAVPCGQDLRLTLMPSGVTALLDGREDTTGCQRPPSCAAARLKTAQPRC